MLIAADQLMAARYQMALSLGFHIVLSCFGVALPAMIYVLHRRGIRNDDAEALALAKKWGKASAVLFAVGAVSGTILSFEMGLLWPGMMSRFGDVIGLPFAMEGIAFFLEAIFIGIYLYGWGRLRPEVHLRTLIPIMLSGLFGTFCIVAVNAWMNAPTGFTVLPDGTVTDVDPLAAIFNDALFPQFLHMFVAAYAVTGFLVAAVYAVGMLRGRRDRAHRIGLHRAVRVRRDRGVVSAGDRTHRRNPARHPAAVEARRDGARHHDRVERTGRDRRAPDRRRGPRWDRDPQARIVARGQLVRHGDHGIRPDPRRRGATRQRRPYRIPDDGRRRHGDDRHRCVVGVASAPPR